MRQSEFSFFSDASPPDKKQVMLPKEFKLEATAMRECHFIGEYDTCDTPEIAAEYWRANIEHQGWHDPEKEMFIVLFLDSRNGIKGHHVVSLGTLNSVNVHPREVFRCAIAIAARSVMLMHNHPSGNPEPSEADIKITRELIRAGNILKIEVMDHVIIGKPEFASLRSLGYFYT